MSKKNKEQKLILGIDPGNEGAFVLIGGESGGSKNIFKFWKMPLKPDGKNNVPDFAKIHELLIEMSLEYSGFHVFLERPTTFGQGSKQAYSYGKGFAALEIALELTELPVTYVEPGKWTKQAHEGIMKDLKPKAKSLIAGKRLFPKLFPLIPVSPKSKKVHEGVLDALLIAGYGMGY